MWFGVYGMASRVGLGVGVWGGGGELGLRILLSLGLCGRASCSRRRRVLPLPCKP